jgi:protease I
MGMTASRLLPNCRPVAVICHGGWVLIETGAVNGRRMTSWPSMATDFRNAGADWVDEELVVCGNGPFNLISSRKPDDLCATYLVAGAVIICGVLLS